MGMTMHFIGLEEPSDTTKKMFKAKAFCDAEGLSYPEEVKEFFKTFGESTTEGEMITLDLTRIGRLFRGEKDAGYEIDVEQIPKGIKTLRFYNSW